MSGRTPGLAASLTRPLLVACGVALISGALLTSYIVRSEYDELLDLSLAAKAELLLPLLADGAGGDDPLRRIEGADRSPDERSVYWLMDATGAVQAQSHHMPAHLSPGGPGAPGFETGGNYRYFVTSPDENGLRLRIGEPLTERNEAVMDSLLGTLLSLMILVAVAYLVMRRAIGQVQGSVLGLAGQIGERSEVNLAPLDPGAGFREMAPAIETMNALMMRLGAAMEAERGFATSAAHELRTPLAVALAHLQRLKAATTDSAVLERAEQVETGLKTLSRLVERLLEMSRAQSGLGRSAVSADVNPVIDLILNETARRKSPRSDIRILPPSGMFSSSMDPDALGIVLSNLADNALRHGTGPGPVVLDASRPGVIVISNDCPALKPEDMARIGERFVRRSDALGGHGVGLSIVWMLCRQSGAELEFASPCRPDGRGFAATLRLPA